MKLSEKKKSVAGKMKRLSLDEAASMGMFNNTYPKRKKAGSKSPDEWNKHWIKESHKGKSSLNPPHKGRDNESMEGKGEKELN